jgi:glucose-6-phosphate isomerase
MTDLSALCGLPIGLGDGPPPLEFREDLTPIEPGIRTLKAIYPVTRDPDPSGPPTLYWMYRDLHRPTHTKLIRDAKLRYDISVFAPGRLGSEYLKSSGHYHPLIPGYPLAYPEVYEIIQGRATFILQKVQNFCALPEQMVVEDIIVLEAEAGQQAMMPPDYGHVTVNTLDEPMVMVNWVSDAFRSHYYSVEKTRGFGYYLLAGELPTYEQNPAYRRVPEIRFARPRNVPALGLIAGRPMYNTCVESPAKFEFLNKPHEHLVEIWEALEF